VPSRDSPAQAGFVQAYLKIRRMNSGVNCNRQATEETSGCEIIDAATLDLVIRALPNQ